MNASMPQYNTHIIFVASLLCGASICLAQDPVAIQGDGEACTMVLKPAEVIAKEDTDYAMNFFSLGQSSQTNAHLFANIAEKAGQGNIDFSNSKALNEIQNSIHYMYHKEFSARWMTPEQLDAYKFCLQNTAKKPVIALIRTWTEDSVVILVKYNPLGSDNAPEPLLLRKLVTLEGVADMGVATQSLPEKLQANAERLISLKREQGKAFSFLLNYPGGPIDLQIPALPRYPCVELSASGKCVKMLQFFNFDAATGVAKFASMPVTPGWNWDHATITVTGKATLSSNLMGPAGLMKFRGFTFKKTEAGDPKDYFEYDAQQLRYVNPAPDASIIIDFSWTQARNGRDTLEVGLKMDECRTYHDANYAARQESASCSIQAVVLTKFIGQQ